MGLRLGEPDIQKLMRKLSTTQFFEWLEVLEREPNEFHWLKWYLAAILHKLFEIPFAVWGKSSGLEPKHFLMDFKAVEAVAPLTEEERQEAIANVAREQMEFSSSVWGSVEIMQKRQKEEGAKKQKDLKDRVTKALTTAKNERESREAELRANGRQRSKRK